MCQTTTDTKVCQITNYELGVQPHQDAWISPIDFYLGRDRESAKAAMSVSPDRKKSRNSKPWYSHVSQILRSTK
jgi:hypothetical protein